MVTERDHNGRLEKAQHSVTALATRLRERATDTAYGTDERATASTGILGFGMLGVGVAQANTAATAFGQSVTWITMQAGAGGIGEALCSVGVGALVTAGLFLAAIYLAYLTIADVVAAAAAGNSRSSGSQHERRDHLKSAGGKAFGAVVVAGMPTILAGLGFSLLGCVDAVNVFNAALVPVPV